MCDLTKGSPAKLISMFTVPLLIGNVFQQFYNMISMIIVGQALDKNALTTVGATGSLTFLVIGFAQGLTADLAIIVAQHYGARGYRGLKKSFTASVVISLVVAMILTALSLLFIRPMLQLVQTPPEIPDQAQIFISIILLGIFASVSFNLLSNAIRALGNSRTPLFFLIIAVIISVVLDLIFVIYFDMGAEDATIATIIAQVSSSVLCLVYIKRKVPLLQLRRKDFKFGKEEFTVHPNVTLPMAFQSSIIATGTIMLQTALDSLGIDVVAAQTAAGRIDQFADRPMMSFGIAIVTSAARNYGTREYGRILQGVRQILLMSVGFSLLTGTIVIFFGHFFVQLFVSPSETRVFELARTYFDINGSLYWILAVLFILRYTLQGLGQSKTPTIADMMELLIRSFTVIVLTGMWGCPGAATASPLAWTGSVAVLLHFYMRSMKQLEHMGEEKHSILEHAEAR